MQSKKFDFKENPITAAIILFIIALVVTAALAGTNELTKDTIILQAKAEQDKARAFVLSQAQSFEDYSSKIDLTKYPKISNMHLAYDINKEVVGFTLVSAAKGYGGDIKIIIGVSINREVSGIKVLSDNETPGLGKKVAETPFTIQFYKKTANKLFSLDKNSTNSNKVDAVTGATISSNALIDAANSALTLAYEELDKLQIGGEK